MFKLFRKLRGNQTDVDPTSGEMVGHGELLSGSKITDPAIAAVAYNELLIAIECTLVIWRGSANTDHVPAPIVHIATLGNWAYTDRQEAVDRVAAKYPELSSQQCQRAAKLIEAQVGRQNRRPMRARHVGRIDIEEKLFWEGRNV